MNGDWVIRLMKLNGENLPNCLSITLKINHNYIFLLDHMCICITYTGCSIHKYSYLTEEGKFLFPHLDIPYGASMYAEIIRYISVIFDHGSTC